jgi:hypothetical protein
LGDTFERATLLSKVGARVGAAPREADGLSEQREVHDVITEVESEGLGRTDPQEAAAGLAVASDGGGNRDPL